MAPAGDPQGPIVPVALTVPTGGPPAGLVPGDRPVALRGAAAGGLARTGFDGELAWLGALLLLAGLALRRTGRLARG